MPEKYAVNELLAPLFALAGAVVMLVFKRELELSRMLLALIAGPLFAWLLTPSLIAWVSAKADWLPRDGSVEGSIGCLVGLLAINIIAIVASAGRRAELIAETIDPLKRRDS